MGSEAGGPPGGPATHEAVPTSLGPGGPPGGTDPVCCWAGGRSGLVLVAAARTAGPVMGQPRVPQHGLQPGRPADKAQRPPGGPCGVFRQGTLGRSQFGGERVSRDVLETWPFPSRPGQPRRSWWILAVLLVNVSPVWAAASALVELCGPRGPWGVRTLLGDPLLCCLGPAHRLAVLCSVTGGHAHRPLQTFLTCPQSDCAQCLAARQPRFPGRGQGQAHTPSRPPGSSIA